ncbi:tyrosine-type recombinase/integrase [Micromonospora matsumotoense]|uniref:tyrosine-type recombinase/integrase n=1 Tax=Micromonospora matsumotoense TaxID=121616 RepID=UPI000A84DD93|nr:tyrosine-type recombinase/integrase [Micromonospora matsumotoense]
MFTTPTGKLITDRCWSELWDAWRSAAGWPKGGTFHSLRHFFATTLMSNGVEPQEVQKALRHASLRITLETLRALDAEEGPAAWSGRAVPPASQERSAGRSGWSRSTLGCALVVPKDLVCTFLQDTAARIAQSGIARTNPGYPQNPPHGVGRSPVRRRTIMGRDAPGGPAVGRPARCGTKTG